MSVVGERRRKFSHLIVFEAFIVAPNSSCDICDVRQAQTCSTQGGVLNITSFILFVIVFVFLLFISKL